MVLEAALAALWRGLPGAVDVAGVGFRDDGRPGTRAFVEAVGAAKLRGAVPEVLRELSAEEAFLAASVEGARSARGLRLVGRGVAFVMVGCAGLRSACCFFLFSSVRIFSSKSLSSLSSSSLSSRFVVNSEYQPRVKFLPWN